MAAADNPAINHEGRPNRNASFPKAFAGFFNGYF
jgi:hypothetical protein